jgi:tetratricopeptide (TPR) repeat protein
MCVANVKVIPKSINNIRKRILGMPTEQKPTSKIISQTMAEDDSDCTANLNGLAAAYIKEGRYSEAESLLIEVLSLRRAIFSEYDPAIAEGLRSLATLYFCQERFSEAEPLYDEARYIDYVALGEHDTIYATDLNNLAELCIIKGRRSEAIPLCKQAFEIRHVALPEDHSDIAQSLHNLAVLGCGDAQALYRQALAIRRTALPPGHSDYIKTAHALIRLYRLQSRWAEAEPLIKEVLEIRRATVPQSLADIADSLNNLATLYQNWGRWTEAEPLSRQVVMMLLENPAILDNSIIQKTSLSVRGSVLNHIYCLHSMGKLHEALPALPPIYREPPAREPASGRSPLRDWYDEMMKDIPEQDTSVKKWWQFWR